MEPVPQLRSSALWLAAGTGLLGVSLGALAMVLGVRAGQQPSQRPGVAEPADRSGYSPTWAPASALEPAAGVEASAGPLVQAVAQTRDAVVNLVTERDLGSGVIVDPLGLVVTNSHVIEGALSAPYTDGTRAPASPSVTARFADGREVQASILVADHIEDLAILRLERPASGEKFSAVTLGRSENLAVGQDVFAVGNPFGLNHSVSRGIISALDRTEVRARNLPLIQLDASINVGNSGGPLFALDGTLVGIVTLRQADAEGIAFAVPVDHVRAFLRSVSDPQAPRGSGSIGVRVEAHDTASEGDILGYRAWLRVTEVEPSGPAQRAGMVVDDHIVEVRGKRLDGLTAGQPPPGLAYYLASTVRSMLPGERLPLTVVREDRLLSMAIEVDVASSDRQMAIDAEELLGLHLTSGAHGVPTIERVDANGPFGKFRGSLKGVELVHLVDRAIRSSDELGAELSRVREHLRRGYGPILVRTVFREPTTGRTRDFMVRIQ